MLLNIKNLHVSIGGKEILKGFNLGVNEGEIHAIMGPNGTGKSRRDLVQRPEHRRDATGGTRKPRHLPEFPVSSGDPGRFDAKLHAHSSQRKA